MLFLSSVSPLSLFTPPRSPPLLSLLSLAPPLHHYPLCSPPPPLTSIFSCSLPSFSSPSLLHSASSSLASSSFVSSPPLSLLYGLLLASTLLFALRLSITLLPSSFSSGFNFYLAPLISSSSLSSLLLHSLHRSFSLPPSRPPSALLPLISSSSASLSL